MSIFSNSLKVISTTTTFVVCAAMLTAPVTLVHATETGVNNARAARIAARVEARRAARVAARRAARKAARIASRNEPTAVCFYNIVDDIYELRTQRAIDALRNVNRSELYSYPVVGEDGTNSCLVAEAPGSDCTVVLADGVEYTVAEFLSTGAAPTNADSDSDSCDISVQDASGTSRIIGLFNGASTSGRAGVFFGTGTSFSNPTNGTLLFTADDYQECALAVEVAVAQASNLVVNNGDGSYVCPEFVQQIN